MAEHNANLTLAITNYDAQWERLVIQSDGRVFAVNNPKKMWDTVLSRWETYCPSDANRELSMVLGDDINLVIIDGKTLELRLPSGKLFAAYTTREDL